LDSSTNSGRIGTAIHGEVPSITGIKVRVGEYAKRSVIFFGVEEDTAIKYGGTGHLPTALFV
jgi:hypothetical protein